jgi:molybdate transport system ATP-binding protein
MRLRILASDVVISLQRPEGVSALNILPATVVEIGPLRGASAVDLRLDCRGITLLARLTAKSVAVLGLAPGAEVHAVIKSVSIDAP